MHDRWVVSRQNHIHEILYMLVYLAHKITVVNNCTRLHPSLVLFDVSYRFVKSSQALFVCSIWNLHSCVSSYHTRHHSCRTPGQAMKTITATVTYARMPSVDGSIQSCINILWSLFQYTATSTSLSWHDTDCSYSLGALSIMPLRQSGVAWPQHAIHFSCPATRWS